MDFVSCEAAPDHQPAARMVDALIDISLPPSTTTVEQNVTEAALDCRDSAAAEGVNRKFGRNRSLIAPLPIIQ